MVNIITFELAQINHIKRLLLYHNYISANMSSNYCILVQVLALPSQIMLGLVTLIVKCVFAHNLCSIDSLKYRPLKWVWDRLETNTDVCLTFIFYFWTFEYLQLKVIPFAYIRSTDCRQIWRERCTWCSQLDHDCLT